MMENLYTDLPKDLLNIITGYYDPWLMKHKNKQKKINRDFINIIRIRNQSFDINYLRFKSREKQLKILYPKVKQMKEFLIIYEEARTFNHHHKQNFEERMNRKNMFCS
jgi:hypothetical protein